MVREIVITTDENSSKSNGVDKEEPVEEPIVEEPEEALVTRLYNGSREAWNAIPSETKWFFYDFLLAMTGLLILFGLTVTGRVVLEYTHQEEGPICRFVHSLDGLLGTSFTQSLCAVQLDIIERLGWHSDNLYNEIKQGMANFVDQISDGFSAFHTIIGSVLAYFATVINDVISELGGNVEENITFLKEFIASGLDWLSSSVSSFLSSFQETPSTSN